MYKKFVTFGHPKNLCNILFIIITVRKESRKDDDIPRYGCADNVLALVSVNVKKKKSKNNITKLIGIGG